MVMGRLIGRIFWGFVCSDGVVREWENSARLGKGGGKSG